VNLGPVMIRRGGVASRMRLGNVTRRFADRIGRTVGIILDFRRRGVCEFESTGRRFDPRSFTRSLAGPSTGKWSSKFKREAMEGDSDGGSRHKSEEETAKKHRAGDRVPGAGLWRRIQSQSRPSTLKTAPLPVFLGRAFTPP
jgi:hypothetical protein